MWRTLWHPFLFMRVFRLSCFCMIGRFPVVDYRHLFAAALFMGLAVPFFIAGLNDAEDPCRIYHGLWHLFVGIASYFMWLMVKTPGATGPYPKMGSIAHHRDAVL
ncbi:hypothetical protein TRSC58_06840 [Trypanosoma rangeli SC58]|uniref:Uncharacterized protein n=1 Tax=Trypanosoma rangeli SC58 TaxID=429131 RepID=A0A061ISR9_TRYRA|nr:hypothetical protein TRSC58_06840 [Trypanosoma rangeli SC58]